MREVLVALVLPPDRLKEIRKDGEGTRATHRFEIQALLEAFGIGGESPEARFWLDLATGAGKETKGLHAIAHRRAHERAPVVDDDLRRLWDQFEDLLITVLPEIERRFAALLPRLRELAAHPSPGKKSLKRFKELPNTYVTRREFFERATLGWFPKLDATGIFDDPPLPVTDPETGTTTLEHWPAADYLARVAKDPGHQARFVAILERVDIPHEFAMRALLEGATALAAPFRERAAAAITKWVRRQRRVVISGPDLSNWVAALGKAGEVAAAAELAEALLELERDSSGAPDGEAARWWRPTPIARLDEWEYEKAIEQIFPALTAADSSIATALAMKLLERALETSERPDDVTERRDGSRYWLTSIAGDDEREFHGQRHSRWLVRALRGALVEWSTDPSRLDAAVEQLNEKQWPLFRRLALHLIQLRGGPQQIAAVALDTQQLESDLPEYRDLLRERFHELPEDVRREHVRLFETRRPRLAYPSGEQIDPADAERWHAAWRRGHLKEIEQGLPADLKEHYAEEVREEVGPVVETEVTRQPVSAEGMAQMSTAEIVEQLRTWNPPRLFGAPTIETQASALRDAVKADPVRFAPAAPAFGDLPPTYVRHYFAGLEGAVRDQKATFDWSAPLELAWAVLQRKEPDPERLSLDEDPGWSWTRKEIADLLRSGLDPSAPRLPVEHREAIWRILSKLVAEAPPAQADLDAGDRDPLHASLNSTRGSSIHAVILYVRWLASDVPAPKTAMKLAPEAAQLLDDVLDWELDQSAATRGAVGFLLGLLVALDREWVSARRDRLFPPAGGDLADMVWRTFMRWNEVRRDVLDLFAEQYARSIAELDPSKTDRPNEEERRLAEHLVMAYIVGWIGLADDGLVQRLYSRGFSRLRAEATGYVGDVLKDTGDLLRPEHCTRARELWQFRRAALAAMSQDERRWELESFGAWFVSGRCDDDWLWSEFLWALELSGWAEPDHAVIGRLAAEASSRPLEAVRAVDLMTREPRKAWFISSSIDEIRSVLVAGLASLSAHPAARDLINRLVADGYRDLAKLLDNGS